METSECNSNSPADGYRITMEIGGENLKISAYSNEGRVYVGELQDQQGNFGAMTLQDILSKLLSSFQSNPVSLTAITNNTVDIKLEL